MDVKFDVARSISKLEETWGRRDAETKRRHWEAVQGMADLLWREYNLPPPGTGEVPID